MSDVSDDFHEHCRKSTPNDCDYAVLYQYKHAVSKIITTAQIIFSTDKLLLAIKMCLIYLNHHWEYFLWATNLPHVSGPKNFQGRGHGWLWPWRSQLMPWAVPVTLVRVQVSASWKHTVAALEDPQRLEGRHWKKTNHSLDSFTVSLHSPNGRHLPVIRAVQGDFQWPFNLG